MTPKITALPPVPDALASAVAAAPTVASRWDLPGPVGTEPDFATLFARPNHTGVVLSTDPGTLKGAAQRELEDAWRCWW